jgi:hypothetical protein
MIKGGKETPDGSLRTSNNISKATTNNTMDNFEIVYNNTSINRLLSLGLSVQRQLSVDL